MIHQIRQTVRVGGTWGPALAIMLCVCGCRTPLDVAGLKNFGRSEEELTSTAGISGPLERALRAARGESLTDDANRDPYAGREEFEQAQATFDAGDYPTAAKAFKKVAKQYKDFPVREDALFMKAEAEFAQQKYSWAQDSYGTLLADFPSTQYMDRVTRRLFTISRTWLDFPEVVTSGDIQPVNFENPKSTPRPETEDDANKSVPLTKRVPILPNFTDRTRPLFDTNGRALEALKAIWLNDPTGPLADDALMLSASHHMKKGDYVEADRILTILRQEYPKSPHLQNAFVLGSHVKLMSYQGPAYDGRSLDAAQELKESTLRVFDDLPANDRERQLSEIRRIEEAKADQDWQMVVFYEKKGKTDAVAIYCQQIIDRFPNTSYADRARQKLAEITPAQVAMQEPKTPLPRRQTTPLDVPEPPRRFRLPFLGQPKPIPEPAVENETTGEPPWSSTPAEEPPWLGPESDDEPPGRVRL